jgi:hypothetical protein
MANGLLCRVAFSSARIPVPLYVTRFLRSLAIVLSCAACTSEARAGDGPSFIIPPTNGYGIAECLAKAGDCGRIVADSWCESKGFSKATGYGPADDVTSAIAVFHEANHFEPGSFIITCTD